jgi:hypothetical protein
MATRAVLAVTIVDRKGVGSTVTWAPEASGCAVARWADLSAVVSVFMNVVHGDGRGNRALGRSGHHARLAAGNERVRRDRYAAPRRSHSARATRALGAGCLDTQSLCKICCVGITQPTLEGSPCA